MPTKLWTIFVILVLGGIPTAFVPVQGTFGALQNSDAIRIYGLVDRPLNLTYSQLISFPMVSEVARLQCVMGIPDVTYNWTGIPLFYLLTLVQIRSEAYKVVTRGSDGFSSDLLVEDALRPTTILALGANGTGLPDISGIQGFFRLVVPHKWGYKWVGDITEIEVVNSDFKGIYESSGWGDPADVPNSGPLPELTPPLETMSFPYGNRTFEVEIFTNASIGGFDFDYFQKRLDINLTVQQGTTGFADLNLQENFLKGPYNITVDEKAVDKIEADLNQSSYIYVSIDQGNHTASIFGTDFFGHIPEILVNYNNTAYAGQTITFNAGRSVDYGRIVSFDWDFGDGTNGSGAVVSHAYGGEGLYEVRLNLTNDEGISNSATLVVTVGTQEYIPLPLRVFLAVTLGMAILVFVALVRSRKREPEMENDIRFTDSSSVRES